MGLKEAIEELKNDIEKAKQAEEGVQEEVVNEPEPLEPPAETPEPTPAPTPAPTEAPQPTPAPEAEPDDKGYARMRREAAAAKKRADDAEAKRLEAEERLAAMQNPPEPVDTPAPTPDPEIEEVKQTLRLNKAEKEFQILENQFKSREPNYEAVSAEYAMALAQSIRIQNPRLSPLEIAERTKKQILIKAGNYMKDGFDPIEELYHEAKDLGFTGQTFRKREEPKQEQETEEEPKPDMKKVAENRKKSTGMSASNGRSEANMTKQYAATELTAEQWAKLPIAEKQRLMYG
jgi:hypothetical protein